MKSPEGTLACDQDSRMHRPQMGLCLPMKGFRLASCWGEDRPALFVGEGAGMRGQVSGDLGLKHEHQPSPPET